MRTLIFDIEGDDLLNKITVIHCVVAKDFDTGEIFRFRPHQIEEAITFLNEADKLVAHNGISFDSKVFLKLYGIEVETTEDTLVMSRTAFPHRKDLDFNLVRQKKLPMNMVGKHSLESWGYRLGFHKGDYGKQEDAWEKYSEEMLEYCVQDVEVTAKLYDHLLKLHIPNSVYQTETEIHKICLQQEINGFPFDLQAGFELHSKLLKRKNELYDEIRKVLGGAFVHNLGAMVTKRTVKYNDVLRGNFLEGCPYTKIKIMEFNPTSRAHVGKRLQERLGWKPTLFGTDGNAELSETTIKTVDHPVREVLLENFMIQKRLGMLADGKFGWLKLVRADGAIHGHVNTMGTQTSRCSHSSPNLAQIPSINSPWGEECRSLFYAPKHWRLFGSDASGLELRCLAHYMAFWDKGAYGKVLLEGDVHTVNQNAMGVLTRNLAKTVTYAILYGAGDEHIGELLGYQDKQERIAAGKKLRANLFKGLPALGKLSEGVKHKAKSMGYIKGLDGRMIPVRSQHSALNFLLQSAGAIICKQWVINFHRILKESGYQEGTTYKQVAFVHDEIQVLFDPSYITFEKLNEISAMAMTEAEVKLGVRIKLDIDSNQGENYAETH